MGGARISGRFNSFVRLDDNIGASPARAVTRARTTHAHGRYGQDAWWMGLETIDRVLLNHAGVWREPRGIFHRGRSPGRRAKERHLGGG